MSPLLFLFTASVAGFLCGGIPFGYLIARWRLKDDIRRYGSGNIGATNVGRVIGWNWGLAVLVLDALKGVLPPLLTRAAADGVPAAWTEHASVAAGLLAIIGHMYPVWLAFRGGKGVATALGVVLVLAPGPLGAALVLFLSVLMATRLMALASCTAAVTFALSYFIFQGAQAWTPARSSLTAFAVAVPALIIWRHRSNIVRLIKGTEPTIGQKVSVHESPDRNPQSAPPEST